MYRQMLYSLLGLTVFIAGCGDKKSIQANSANREKFVQSIIVLNQSRDLAQPPDNSTGPFSLSAETEKRIDSLTQVGLSLSEQVEDSFLESLHPELRARYRDFLIKGTRMYSRGLQENRAGNFSAAVQLQSQGNQLIIEWISWWEKHQKEIGDQVFQSGRSFWGMLIRLIIGSILSPIVFSFVIVPFFGLMYLTMKNNRTELGFASYPVLGVLFIVQLYFWGLWAAFCSTEVVAYTSASDVSFRWFHYLLGFAFCSSPIAWLTNKEKQSAQSASESSGIPKGAGLYKYFALGTYIVFSLWPQIVHPPYGWFLDWI